MWKCWCQPRPANNKDQKDLHVLLRGRPPPLRAGHNEKPWTHSVTRLRATRRIRRTRASPPPFAWRRCERPNFVHLTALVVVVLFKHRAPKLPKTKVWTLRDLHEIILAPFATTAPWHSSDSAASRANSTFPSVSTQAASHAATFATALRFAASLAILSFSTCRRQPPVQPPASNSARFLARTRRLTPSCHSHWHDQTCQQSCSATGTTGTTRRGAPAQQLRAQTAPSPHPATVRDLFNSVRHHPAHHGELSHEVSTP